MEASAHPAGPEAGGGDPRARERQEREKAWREAFNTALEQHVQNRGKGGKGKGAKGTSVLTEAEYQERLDACTAPDSKGTRYGNSKWYAVSNAAPWPCGGPVGHGAA